MGERPIDDWISRTDKNTCKVSGIKSEFISRKLRGSSILYASKPELSLVEEHEDSDDVIIHLCDATPGDKKVLGRMPRRLSRSSGGLFSAVNKEMESGGIVGVNNGGRRRYLARGMSGDSVASGIQHVADTNRRAR